MTNREKKIEEKQYRKLLNRVGIIERWNNDILASERAEDMDRYVNLCQELKIGTWDYLDWSSLPIAQVQDKKMLEKLENNCDRGYWTWDINGNCVCNDENGRKDHNEQNISFCVENINEIIDK